MRINELKITNSIGDTIEFSSSRHFRLLEGFDLSNLTAKVNTVDSTMDGSHYQSTKLASREFDLTFFIHRNYEDFVWLEKQRNELFKVFNPKRNPMRINFTTKGGQLYYVNTELLAAPSLPQGFENDNQAWQKGLLQFTCSDPFIYEANAIEKRIAYYVDGFGFELEIPTEGMEMSYRADSQFVYVDNNGQEATGMLLTFEAEQEVVNPSLLNVMTYEELKLNTTMLPGDIIEVSTYSGKRSITLIRDNVRTNVFNILDLSSVFLQLEIGRNVFRYNAESGIDFMSVSMSYTPKRIGV